MHDAPGQSGLGRSEIESQLERPACPLCGGDASKLVLEAQDDWNPEGPARGLKFEVRRCEICSACFTSPRFRMEAKSIPFLGAYPFYKRARSCEAPPTNKEMQAFISRADALESAHHDRGRVLDIGMGDGAFLKEMRKRGWSVSGIDNEPDVVAYARKQLMLQDSVTADVEADPLPQGPFDAVTMWGLLQLTYRPQAVLEKVRGVLAAEGVVGIGVSNFAGAGARLFGKHWNGLGLPRHLIHFEPDSLQRLLKQTGYEVAKMSYETPYWIAGASIQAAMPLPGLLGRICRRSLGAMLGLVGRSRIGDTMTVIARLSR